jgi:hypothetical protein
MLYFHLYMFKNAFVQLSGVLLEKYIYNFVYFPFHMLFIFEQVQMNRMNQHLNARARYGLVTSKERVHHYLEMMMLHAAKHPWMRWTAV